MARLSGLGAIVLIAGGGAAAYVIEFHPASDHHHAPLPKHVASYQTVGLIAHAASNGSGATSRNLVQLLSRQGSPAFTSLSTAAADAQGNPEWTADLMTGGTYIFIFEPDGNCLAVIGHAKLGLRHCNLSAAQRWRRVNATAVVEDGHNFYQYANLADGRCLSDLAGPGPQGGAGLAHCGSAQLPSQLLAFWWSE
jgi:hypothetical protein